MEDFSSLLSNYRERCRKRRKLDRSEFVGRFFNRDMAFEICRNLGKRTAISLENPKPAPPLLPLSFVSSVSSTFPDNKDAPTPTMLMLARSQNDTSGVRLARSTPHLGASDRNASPSSISSSRSRSRSATPTQDRVSPSTSPSPSPTPSRWGSRAHAGDEIQPGVWRHKLIDPSFKEHDNLVHVPAECEDEDDVLNELGLEFRLDLSWVPTKAKLTKDLEFALQDDLNGVTPGSKAHKILEEFCTLIVPELRRLDDKGIVRDSRIFPISQVAFEVRAYELRCGKSYYNMRPTEAKWPIEPLSDRNARFMAFYVIECGCNVSIEAQICPKPEEDCQNENRQQSYSFGRGINLSLQKGSLVVLDTIATLFRVYRIGNCEQRSPHERVVFLKMAVFDESGLFSMEVLVHARKKLWDVCKKWEHQCDVNLLPEIRKIVLMYILPLE